MRDEGKIKYIGLSEVSIDQIEEAKKYIEVMAVQNQYSMDERKHEDVLDYCEKEKIVFIPWAPLGGGSISDPKQALVWLIQRSPIILPIPGSGFFSRMWNIQRNSGLCHLGR